ncbi:MAG: ROK family transcriptional regulator [Clostridia bacterium]|nr:ROK family transcriptional regulator [Clostridia bacterium]
MKSLDQSSIRKQNILRILHLLTRQSPRTRQSLAEATGLSLMTVTNLVDQLKEQQALALTPVERCSEAKRSSGRKAENISLSGVRHAWLIVDLSGSSFRFTLLGFDLSVILEKTYAAEGDYLPRLEAFLRSVKEEITLPLCGRDLLGVAVVAPGPYEIASDTVYNQRLPELNNVRIKALMTRCLGEYDYYVDEDVKFAVRAFSPLVEDDPCELLYYLYIGEGVGGAAVHNGNMLRGLNATAGDAGQLTTPGGATYESLLSLPAFAATLGCRGDSIRQLTESLSCCAANRPDDYLHALGCSANVVSEMLYNVLWVLDPSHIIVDCRYALDHQDAFIRRIADSLSLRLSASGKRFPLIAPAPQGISSVIRGAVLVLQREWIERILA